MAPKFVCAHIRAMDGQPPGEPPAAAGERLIKLNTNENPFPPSPKVMAAIRDVEPEMLRRYPNANGDSFRAAAAKVIGVSPDMILCGNGADDVLTIATRTFVGAGNVLASPVPGYARYATLAKLEEAKFFGLPWEKDWALPIEALAESKAAAIFLPNPNSMSGTVVPSAEIAALADAFDGAVVVDEAYVDFADESSLPLVKEHANVVVVRSLSKAYSLAGLRFGYAIAQEAVIEEMLKAKDSFNVDAIALTAACAAIEDQEYAQMTWQNIRAERERLTTELEAVGWRWLLSRTNFLLATVPDRSGKEMINSLKR